MRNRHSVCSHESREWGGGQKPRNRECNKPNGSWPTGLGRFNPVRGVLRLVRGLFMILVGRHTTYPIFTYHPSLDLSTRSLKPGPELSHELPFGPALACFLLNPPVAHIFLRTIGHGRCVQDLENGMSPVCFHECARVHRR
jgi:hypothetical protein